MQKDTLQELRDLRAAFNAQSQAALETLDKAIQLAQSAERKPLDAKTAEILKDLGFRNKKAAPKSVTLVLVDGSGSMGSKEDILSQSPLAIFFEGSAAALASMPKEPIAFSFWGENTGIRPIKCLGFFLSPNSGSDLAPAIDDLETIAAHLPSKTKLRVVLVSDGDIFDREKSTEKLKTLLNTHPNVTLSAMFITQSDLNSTQMGMMLKDMFLDTECVSISRLSSSASVANELRTQLAENKPAVLKSPARPKPGK